MLLILFLSQTNCGTMSHGRLFVPEDWECKGWKRTEIATAGSAFLAARGKTSAL